MYGRCLSAHDLSDLGGGCGEKLHCQRLVTPPRHAHHLSLVCVSAAGLSSGSPPSQIGPGPLLEGGKEAIAMDESRGLSTGRTGSGRTRCSWRNGGAHRRLLMWHCPRRDQPQWAETMTSQNMVANTGMRPRRLQKAHISTGAISSRPRTEKNGDSIVSRYVLPSQCPLPCARNAMDYCV